MKSWQDEIDRMAVRKAIDEAGGAVRAYTPQGIQVAVGQSYSELRNALLQHNFQPVDLYFFPLGTDKPEMNLRHINLHYQKPGDDPGCWLVASFEWRPTV